MARKIAIYSRGNLSYFINPYVHMNTNIIPTFGKDFQIQVAVSHLSSLRVARKVNRENQSSFRLLFWNGKRRSTNVSFLFNLAYNLLLEMSKSNTD